MTRKTRVKVVVLVVTVKDLAHDLHVTRQTVRNEMKRQGIEPVTEKDANGRQFFSVDEEAAEKISEGIRKRNEIRPDTKEPERRRLEKDKEDLAARCAALEKENEDLRNQLAQTEVSLAAKDETIRRQDEQLRKEEERSADLMRMMENLSESLKAAQVIAAGRQIEQHNDKKWWQFWK